MPRFEAVQCPTVASVRHDLHEFGLGHQVPQHPPQAETKQTRLRKKVKKCDASFQISARLKDGKALESSLAK